MISVHCQETRLWELIKWSPKRKKYFDLLSNSLNSFFKEIYRDQFGEFVFRYWGLKVNNEDWGRGQRSVVWLMPSQPCFHHLHVLSTMCSCQPLSSFNLWIILLPPSPPPFHWLISVTGALLHWSGGSWLKGMRLPAMGA